MIDVRILAVGAMALLMAAYCASSVVGPRIQGRDFNPGEITGSIKKSARIAPARIDGFDLGR